MSALEEITIETPDFASELYSRYYIANQQQAPVFTSGRTGVYYIRWRQNSVRSPC
jgi:hypothetical protein